MLQHILGTIVFVLSLGFSYVGWILMDEAVSGAVLGFLLIAAPGFYYVYEVMPVQQARKRALREDEERSNKTGGTP